MHLILLGLAPLQNMNRALGIALHDERIRGLRPLLAFQDVKVVVGCVTARMSFGSERGAEHDEVFGYAGMDYVHGAHGAAGVVEYPFAFERRNLVFWLPS